MAGYYRNPGTSLDFPTKPAPNFTGGFGQGGDMGGMEVLTTKIEDLQLQVENLRLQNINNFNADRLLSDVNLDFTFRLLLLGLFLVQAIFIIIIFAGARDSDDQIQILFDAMDAFAMTLEMILEGVTVPPSPSPSPATRSVGNGREGWGVPMKRTRDEAQPPLPFTTVMSGNRHQKPQRSAAELNWEVEQARKTIVLVSQRVKGLLKTQGETPTSDQVKDYAIQEVYNNLKHQGIDLQSVVVNHQKQQKGHNDGGSTKDQADVAAQGDTRNSHGYTQSVYKTRDVHPEPTSTTSSGNVMNLFGLYTKTDRGMATNEKDEKAKQHEQFLYYLHHSTEILSPPLDQENEVDIPFDITSTVNTNFVGSQTIEDTDAMFSIVPATPPMGPLPGPLGQSFSAFLEDYNTRIYCAPENNSPPLFSLDDADDIDYFGNMTLACTLQYVARQVAYLRFLTDSHEL